MLKFLRFNYQLLWEQQDHDAYINFPEVLTEVERLPFIISTKNKHLRYGDLTSCSTHYFQLITLDDQFTKENSETSDNRPFTTANIISETLFEVYDHDISQLNPYNNTQAFYNQEPQQLDILPDKQPDTTTLRNLPDSSDTLTVQIISELSYTTTNISTKFYSN